MRSRDRDGFIASCGRCHLAAGASPSLSSIAAKIFAILGHLDAFHAGADDRHARARATRRQIQRRLAAKLHDHAIGLHLIADIEHVFDRERLEEEHIAGVVIGANGFRIRVDHDVSKPNSRSAKLAWQQQ